MYRHIFGLNYEIRYRKLIMEFPTMKGYNVDKAVEDRPKVDRPNGDIVVQGKTLVKVERRSPRNTSISIDTTKSSFLEIILTPTPHYNKQQITITPTLKSNPNYTLELVSSPAPFALGSTQQIIKVGVRLHPSTMSSLKSERNSGNLDKPFHRFGTIAVEVSISGNFKCTITAAFVEVSKLCYAEVWSEWGLYKGGGRRKGRGVSVGGECGR